MTDKATFDWLWCDRAGVKPDVMAQELVILCLFLRIMAYHSITTNKQGTHSLLDKLHDYAIQRLVEEDILIGRDSDLQHFNQRYEQYLDLFTRKRELQFQVMNVTEEFLRICKIPYEVVKLGTASLYFTASVMVERKILADLERTHVIVP